MTLLEYVQFDWVTLSFRAAESRAIRNQIVKMRVIYSDSTLADASLYEERRLEFGIVEGGIETRGALPVYRNADLMHGMRFLCRHFLYFQIELP